MTKPPVSELLGKSSLGNSKHLIPDRDERALSATRQDAISTKNVNVGNVQSARYQGCLKPQCVVRKSLLSSNDETIRAVFSGNEEMARVYFKKWLRCYDRVMRYVEEETHAWMPADREEVWIIFASQIIFAFAGKTKKARNIDAYAKSTLFSAVNAVWSKIQKRGEGELPDQSVSRQGDAELAGKDKKQQPLHPADRGRVLGRLLGIPDIPHTLVAACLGIDQTGANDDVAAQTSEKNLGFAMSRR